MFLFHSIPVSARPTYFHHLRAMIFNGMKLGITSLISVIAAQSLHASEWQLAAIISAQGLGMIVRLCSSRQSLCR